MKNLEKKWMTIKQASDLFKKHPDTIRNLAKNNPSETKKDGKGRVIIKTSLLLSHFDDFEIEKESEEKATEQAITEEKKADESLQSNGKILDALLKELDQKDNEINRLHGIIEKMTEQQNALIDQQQKITGFQLQATNSTTEQGKTNQHWWNSRKKKK